ncbi:hypothetical protein MMC18_000418 [Xylographa bjoerkii]|nr:hypothetical protein [Xylographa bjoerkii]
MVARWQLALLASAAEAVALVQLLPKYSISGSYGLTFAAIFSLHFLGLAIWTVFLYPKLFSPIRHLPQPSGASFFNGHFSKIVKEPTGKPMLEWVNSVPNHGLIRYTTLLNSERILVTNAKGLGEVLVTKNYDFVKPSGIREGIGKILGVGILLAEGEEHKIQRKHLMPAFAYRHIKDLYPSFWAKSRELVQALSAFVKEEAAQAGQEKDLSSTAVVALGTWMSRATLDIIGVAGMGQDFNAIEDPETELYTTYKKIFQPSRAARMIGLASMFIPIQLLRMLPLKRNDEIMAASDVIKSVSRNLIRSKQRKMAEEKGRADVDILSVALESGGFSEEDLVNQMMTFLVAGHETTATSMQWALITLCQYPEMQTRLREEVRANLPSPNDATAQMSADILDRLPYLHAVCNEVLRVYPAVPMTRRVADHDTSILGQFIPKGTDVFLAPGAINLSIDLWGEDALEFKPDRWLGSGTNNGGASSNYALLTFLHGPRSCIGQAFAKAEFACLLAAMVGRFELELVDKNAPILIQTGITARPKGDLGLRTRVLEGW